MMPKISKFLLIGAAAAALSGCASIAHGPYEKISVTSSPEKALCKIYREGHGYVKSVATPGEVYITRDPAAVTITCSKAGYQTTSMTANTARSEQDNIGNFATIGATFFVDLANSTQDRLPDEVHINLPKE